MGPVNCFSAAADSLTCIFPQAGKGSSKSNLGRGKGLEGSSWRPHSTQNPILAAEEASVDHLGDCFALKIASWPWKTPRRIVLVAAFCPKESRVPFVVLADFSLISGYPAAMISGVRSLPSLLAATLLLLFLSASTSASESDHKVRRRPLHSPPSLHRLISSDYLARSKTKFLDSNRLISHFRILSDRWCLLSHFEL